MHEKIDENILAFEKNAIICNIIETFYTLFNFIIENKIEFENTQNKMNMLNMKETLFIKDEIQVNNYSKNIHLDFLQAWKDKAFQEAFKQKSKLQIYDGSFYFLEHLKKYKPEFTVDLGEILYSRKKTIGINKIVLDVELPKKIIYDVGGKK
jgi:hypothetical protein